MKGAREESQIPISNCSSGSETPSVTRNDSRDLTVSQEEISLKSSRASRASFTLPFQLLAHQAASNVVLVSVLIC